MKILTVTHFYEAHGGGIERVAAHLCRQFAESGHRAMWAASDADPRPDGNIRAVPLCCANPIETLTGLPMPIPGLRAVVCLRRAIRASDAVIVHDALYVTSVVALLLAKIHRKPVILVQHIANIAFANRAMRGLMRLATTLVTRPMLAAATERVFISDAVRRELLGEVPRRRYRLLYNGVDTATFHPRTTSRRLAARATHGIPADVRLAIFVGRFVEKKGLAVLEAIARRRPDLHVAFVGAGPLRPENWKLPNVHLLGPQSQQAIAELYGASDLLLLPSVGEGYPLVIQEAMACGLAVVCGVTSARADPGAALWLRGVEIDLAEPALSAIRCSEAIDRLFASPPDRTAMAAYAARTYSWSSMASAIVEYMARG